MKGSGIFPAAGREAGGLGPGLVLIFHKADRHLPFFAKQEVVGIYNRSSAYVLVPIFRSRLSFGQF